MDRVKDVPGGLGAMTPSSPCKGPRFDPFCGGSKLHKPQLRVCLPQLQTPPAATKTQRSQIDEYS